MQGQEGIHEIREPGMNYSEKRCLSGITNLFQPVPTLWTSYEQKAGK